MCTTTTLQNKTKTTPARSLATRAGVLAAILAALFLAACEPESSTENKPTLSVFYSCASPATNTTTSVTSDPSNEITSLALVVGETKQLFAETAAATWTSSNRSIVTVSNTGELTAVAAGKTVVIASASGLEDANIDIVVVATGATPPPITLKTEGDLRLMGCTNSAGGLGATYLLANDITLTKDWEPLGAFSGTLDGGGHYIKNLVINKPSTDKVGFVSENLGTITNIGVEIGANGIRGQNRVGALAGENSGTIRAVVSGPGTINGTSYVGGLVGYVGENVQFVGGVVLTDVTGSKDFVGGLVGIIDSGSLVGYATGTVTGPTAVVDSSLGSIGGIVGGADNVTIAGYHAGESVTGRTATAGGVGDLRSRGSFNGYARSKIFLQGVSTTTTNGQVVGGDGGGTSNAAYYSATESTIINGSSNNLGKSISIDGSKTGPEQGYFDQLAFGTDVGEWTFYQGKWPSINLPADAIFDPYRGANQPINP